MRGKSNSAPPIVPSFAYRDTGALDGPVASTVRWMRKQCGDNVRDPAWLGKIIERDRNKVEENRPAALAYCKLFAATPAEDIPFAEMMDGESALKDVREALRDIAACSFLLEQIEAAKVVRLVTTKGRTKEALEVGDTIDGLSPYERTRLVALARDFARKAKEREASYGDADDEEEPPEVRS